MGYRGRVRSGTIVFDEPTSLPEGAVVEVVVVQEGGAERLAIPTLAERFAAVVGIAEGLPPDLATSRDRDVAGAARPSET